MKLGTISAVDNINGLTLIIDGESSATTKKYHYLASYNPVAGDRVLIEEVGDSYVIIGKVITDFSESVGNTVMVGFNLTAAGLAGRFMDGHLGNRVTVARCSTVWNQQYKDIADSGICFRCYNGEFYIAEYPNYTTWKKIAISS